MRRPSQQSFVGRILMYAGGTIAVIGFGCCKVLPRTESDPEVAILASLAFLAGATVALIGKMISPKEADAAIRRDGRPPVVFLRSFAQDDPRLGYRLFRQIFFFGGFLQTVYSYEEILADVFSEVGPFVALGRPGEALETPGAARKYAEDDAWKAVFEDWLQRASLVVIQAGGSDNLLWEIAKVVGRNQPRRTVIYVPGVEAFSAEELEEESLPHNPREDFYKNFYRTASDSFPQGLPLQIGPHMFIWFDDSWNPALLKYERLSLIKCLTIGARTRPSINYVETRYSARVLLDYVANSAADLHELDATKH